MFGIDIPPPPPLRKYALVAGVKPSAVLGDDWNALQLDADRLQGASVMVRLPDGKELVIGKVDYTLVSAS